MMHQQKILEQKVQWRSELETNFRTMIKKSQASEKLRDQVLSTKIKSNQANTLEQAKIKDPTAPTEPVADDGTGDYLALAKEHAEDQDQLYEDKLFAGYIKKYTALSRQMVIDYKKYAINTFLTEMYCDITQTKGQSKHKDLLERALY